MTTVLLSILALIFYTYFGYLLLVIILGMIINKKVNKKAIEPNVAFMIAAYNEEKCIQEKILNTLELDYPKDKLRIIIVSDGSTDRTDEIVKSFQHTGVELMRIEGRVGKTEARNLALRNVSEEIVIFSDATTIYEKNAVKMLVQNFADETVGMVTGHLIYQDPQNTQIGAGQKLFWKYESLIKKAQTKMGTLTGSIGCITAFRRKSYTALPGNVIEDFTEPLMFIQKNFRIVYEENAICFEKTTQKTKSEWTMRVRVIRGGLTGLIFAKEVLNPLFYPVPFLQLFSHKILRWLIPVFGILLFVTNAVGLLVEPPNLFVNYLFYLQVLFYLVVLISFLLEKRGYHNKILGIPLYFFVLNAAALVALIKTISSKLEATWETDRP
jgi:cellulose synthase/poly-beta-1,6-N-acetylglucosamine synthase-like glycosyltransferase